MLLFRDNRQRNKTCLSVKWLQFCGNQVFRATVGRTIHSRVRRHGVRLEKAKFLCSDHARNSRIIASKSNRTLFLFSRNNLFCYNIWAISLIDIINKSRKNWVQWRYFTWKASSLCSSCYLHQLSLLFEYFKLYTYRSNWSNLVGKLRTVMISVYSAYNFDRTGIIAFRSLV